MNERPEAIIITFPVVFFQEYGVRRFARDFQGLTTNDDMIWYAKISTVPKIEVPHCYIIAGNRVRWRLNVVGFEPGHAKDFGSGRQVYARNWMLLAGPVSKAPYRIERRGHQGFRYVAEGFW